MEWQDWLVWGVLATWLGGGLVYFAHLTHQIRAETGKWLHPTEPGAQILTILIWWVILAGRFASWIGGVMKRRNGEVL
ncbi:MAG: hypothetical protein WD187_04005 [Candidatus Woykebacteria bacterium]